MAVFGAVAAVSAEEDGAILTAIKVMKDCENKPIFLCLKVNSTKVHSCH